MDPDFLSLVEANRFQPSPKDFNSPKAQARGREKKKAYLNENICLRLVPPPSSLSPESGNNKTPESTGTWNIPRFRLTKNFLHGTVNRGRDPSLPTLVVSHLHDQRTNTVILPKDLHECRSSPVIYHVHVVSAVAMKRGGVLSCAGDSYYKGDVIFFVKNLPRLSKSERYEVVPDDVHRWLVHGAISGIEDLRIQSSKVDNLKQTLQELGKNMKHVHAAPVYNEHGRAIVGSPLKDAREAKFKFLQDEKEQVLNRLQRAQQSMEATWARHFSACSLTITERRETIHSIKDSNVFSVKVTGKKKDYYTSLIRNKTDWSLVPMFATGEKTAKAISKHRGSKSAAVLTIGEADQVEHFVDLGLISIEMIPDGFGVLETYYEYDPFATDVNFENKNSRGQHRLFHGYFREGEYHEGTLHTDAGVYSGTFVSNEPCKGTMKYLDGVVLTGDFALPPGNGRGVEDDSELANPYRRGLPHGNDIHIQFRDSARHEGGMCHGRVTGTGIFSYPMDHVHVGNRVKQKVAASFNEVKGDFVNGTLQNNDGVEGQGGSNLLRSLLFGGERLWS